MGKSEAIGIAIECIGWSEFKIRDHDYGNLEREFARTLRKDHLDRFREAKKVLSEIKA